MPWRNISMLDARHNFIIEALDSRNKLNFSDLCYKYNISTKTGYKWLGRYRENGNEGLKDLPRTPRSQPTKISDEVKQCVISIREEFSHWGPKKIRSEILKNHENLPILSEASIGNILHEHNLVRPRGYRRHVAKTSPLSECKKPNDTWMYDFKGWFLTGDGDKCEPLTITDGFSRYVIECKHMYRKRGMDVWNVLERAFYEYGLPNKMRSDNGPPFASLSLGRLSALAIKLIKVGITPEWIEPGCPEQNGRHERFHLTLKQETTKPPALTVALQQEKFNQFKAYFNFRRPHEALQQVTPSTIYIPSNRIWDGKFHSPEYSADYDKRKVGKSGSIEWRGSSFFLSEMLYQEYVGIKEIDVGLMGIYYGPILLGKIDLNKGFKRI